LALPQGRRAAFIEGHCGFVAVADDPVREIVRK
jgi:hypothetical protein